MRKTTLDQLRHLRERQRDIARQALGAAVAAERRFDEQRRGWRRRVEAEATSAGADTCAYERWVDACRTHERLTEPQALELRQRVAEAEHVYRLTDRAVEQLESLEAERCRVERRAAERRMQRQLDDVRRPPDAPF